MATGATLGSVFYVTGVDLKSATATTLVPTVTGKRFFPRRAWMKFDTLTAASGNPFILIESEDDAGAANTLVALTQLDRTLGVDNIIEFSLSSTGGVANLDPTTGAAITVEKSILATGTTVTGSFFIEGVYI